jgi:hypothetical protein
MTSAPNCSGCWITSRAFVPPGSPAAGSSSRTTRASDRRAGDLDESPLPRAEPDCLGDLEADGAIALSTSPAWSPAGTRVLVDRHVVVDESFDRHLGLERGAGPSARRSAIRRMFSPNARIDPAAGLTKPLSMLKNVVLPAPFADAACRPGRRSRRRSRRRRTDSETAD